MRRTRLRSSYSKRMRLPLRSRIRVTRPGPGWFSVSMRYSVPSLSCTVPFTEESRGPVSAERSKTSVSETKVAAESSVETNVRPRAVPGSCHDRGSPSRRTSRNSCSVPSERVRTKRVRARLAAGGRRAPGVPSRWRPGGPSPRARSPSSTAAASRWGWPRRPCGPSPCSGRPGPSRAGPSVARGSGRRPRPRHRGRPPRGAAGGSSGCR